MTEQTPEIEPGESAENAAEFRVGYTALFGEPNAGKSTLLNRILGQKIVIVSPKPQTTRDRIVGIAHRDDAQIAFVDTPGVHRARGRGLNAAMVSQALGAIHDVDAVVVVVDAAKGARRGSGELSAVESSLVAALEGANRPVIVALNKVDRVSPAELLPLIQMWSDALPATAYVPVSALKGDGIDALLDAVQSALPQGPPAFDDDELTDRPMRFLAAEIVREKLMLQLGSELPYATAVEVERWEDKPRSAVIHVAIHIEKNSQKAIVIGRGGSRIKAIGVAARTEIEELVGKSVYLETFVRVQSNWTKDERSLKRFGYEFDTRGQADVDSADEPPTRSS